MGSSASPIPAPTEGFLLDLARLLQDVDSGVLDGESTSSRIVSIASEHFGEGYMNGVMMFLCMVKTMKQANLLPDPPAVAVEQQQEDEPDFIDFFEERQD